MTSVKTPARLITSPARVEPCIHFPMQFRTRASLSCMYKGNDTSFGTQLSRKMSVDPGKGCSFVASAYPLFHMQVTTPCLGDCCLCFCVVSPGYPCVEVTDLSVPCLQAFAYRPGLNLSLPSFGCREITSLTRDEDVPTTGLRGSNRWSDVNDPVDDCCGSEVRGRHSLRRRGELTGHRLYCRRKQVKRAFQFHNDLKTTWSSTVLHQ